MQAFFSSDGPLALQFLVIFVVILVLLLIAALLFMRLSGRGLTLSAGAGQRGRHDIYELDRQRQLILLRRDNVEHLLLVGGPNDVVVERHIQRGAGSRYAAEGHARSGEIGAADAGGLEPPRTDPFFDSPMPPTFAMPEVVPPAISGAPPAGDRAPPLDPGLFEPEPDSAPDPAPVMASREPRAVDPAVLSDMARQLQVALKRPSSAVTPPPGGASEAPPPPASKPAEPVMPRADPIAAAMAGVRPAEPVRSSPATAVPPPVVPVSPELAPAAVPSPPQSEPKPEPRSEPKPKAAAKPVAPPQFVAPSRPESAKPNLPRPEAARSEAAKAEPATSEPSRPEPARFEPPRPEASKIEASEAAAQGQNPFSVEEIEAEFARLLGRPLDSKT